MAIPLCLPNNCRWSSATGEYIKTGERRSSLYTIDEALQKLRTVRGKKFHLEIIVEHRFQILFSVLCIEKVFNYCCYLHYIDLTVSLNCSYLYYQYHPTSGLMQILYFDWLRYQGTNSNSHEQRNSPVFLSFFPPNKYFFNLHLLTLLLPFLSGQLGDTKTIRPFTLKGHGSIAHEAKSNGLLTHSPFRLQV